MYEKVKEQIRVSKLSKKKIIGYYALMISLIGFNVYNMNGEFNTPNILFLSLLIYVGIVNPVLAFTRTIPWYLKGKVVLTVHSGILLGLMIMSWKFRSIVLLMSSLLFFIAFFLPTFTKIRIDKIERDFAEYKTLVSKEIK